MAQFSGSTYSAAVDESKRLIALAMLGITNYDFDKTTNKLTLYMQDGTVVEAALTADSSPGEQNVNLQSLIDDTIITTTKTNSSSKIHMDIQAAIAECKDDTLKQITNLQSLIDDTTITTTKTNSSSKIHADIQAAIAECKDDTLKQIAKKVSGSYKIATSTTEVTSADHIYLINNGSNYDLYVLVEGNPTKVGDTSIDLSDYAKLTDLDNYYDKSASDGKFATITTLDAHINDTVAHMTQDEKDKLLTSDNITTTIDSTSTDNQVVGALTTYNAFKELETKITVQNLFPATYHNLPVYTANGVTSTINDDGSITFNGTSTGTHFSVIYHRDYNGLGKAVKLRGKTLTLSGGKPSPVLSIAFYDEDGNNVTPPDNAMKYDTGKGVTITVPDNAYSIYSYYYISAGTYDNVTLYPMLEEGEVTHSFISPKDTKLTKGDIVTTIDSTSTYDTIPSAKAVNTLLNNKVNKMAMLTSQNIDDLINEGSYYVIAATNAPDAYGWVDVLANNDYTIQLFYPSITTNCEMYIRRRREGVWGKWQRVCTTKVADVPKTEITFSNTSIYTPAAALYNYYEVKDGVCYVSLYVNCNNASTGPLTVINESLPIPKRKEYKTLSAWNNATDNIRCVVEENGRLSLRLGTSGGQYIETFTYKVAES